MTKKLSEMSLEELWQLFPIFLTEHNDQWFDYYNEMKVFLESIFEEFQVKRISHIGSTSIKNIWAKPVIDILVEIDEKENMNDIAKAVEKNGFRYMSTDENRVSFNHGYTENGFADKVYHLHLRYVGDNNELYFRDYLNEHSQIAKAYEQLKLELWKQYEHNRDGYTNAKTDFIMKWTCEAKQLYGDRYS